jgi:hypothetical protein
MPHTGGQLILLYSMAPDTVSGVVSISQLYAPASEALIAPDKALRLRPSSESPYALLDHDVSIGPLLLS